MDQQDEKCKWCGKPRKEMNYPVHDYYYLRGMEHLWFKCGSHYAAKGGWESRYFPQTWTKYDAQSSLCKTISEIGNETIWETPKCDTPKCVFCFDGHCYASPKEHEHCTQQKVK